LPSREAGDLDAGASEADGRHEARIPGAPERITRIGRRRLTRSGPTLAKDE
jgi:hypothetical protein